MAEASSVSFDVLLGGKVTPEALKAIKEMEEHLKKFGASTRTINAAMSRIYKETFDGISKEAKKTHDDLIKGSLHVAREMTKHFQEAGKKIKESFAKIGESYKKLTETLKKPLEFLGITSALGVVGGTFAGGFGLAELA